MRVLGSLRLGEPRRPRNEACRSCRRRPGVVRPGTSRSSIPKHMTLHRGDLVRVPFIPRTPQGLALESSTVLQVADTRNSPRHGWGHPSTYRSPAATGALDWQPLRQLAVRCRRSGGSRNDIEGECATDKAAPRPRSTQPAPTSGARSGRTCLRLLGAPIAAIPANPVRRAPGHSVT